MQERCITYTVGGAQAEFIHMKSTSKKRTPSIVNLTVQATLSHRARGRAADELCPQVWPLRASRRDHDPGGLPPWPAGIGGLRPAMATDRAVRGPPPRSSGQERDSQCAPNPG